MKKCGAACFCQTTSCSVACFWVRYKKSLSKFHFLGQFFFFKYFRWWYSKTSILMLFCMYSFAIFSFKVPLVTVWRRHIMQYVCDLINRVKFWIFAKMNFIFSPFNLSFGLTKFAEYKTRSFILLLLFRWVWVVASWCWNVYLVSCSVVDRFLGAVND